MAPLRIAILECDTPLTNTKAQYGGYGGVFDSLLQKASKAIDSHPELQTTKYDVVNEPEKYPALEDIDAILLTGSKHNSFDDIPWINTLVSFVQKTLAQDRVRIVGICFGHQIVGRALGFEVGRNDGGWEVAVTDIELSEKGKEVLGLEKLRIHQMHRDIVRTVPTAANGIELLGSTNVCANQGMYAPRRLITVQGHPEFTTEIMTEIVNARHDIGVFDDALFEDGISRVPNEHDGVTVAVAFLKFLLEK